MGDTGEGEVLTIGEAAQKLGVTLRLLRFYESRGLIKPIRANLQRLYDEETIGTLRRIQQLTRYGFTLLEIRNGVTKRQMVAQHGDLRQRIVEMDSAAHELAAEIAGHADG